MPITQAGSINLNALQVPDIYVQIAPPSNYLLNGVPTNVLGIVGTAPWGPVNSPVAISDVRAYALAFGAVQARKYDLGTQVALACQQGANFINAVRVTDGTDVAAAATIQTNCLTVTAKYTGTLGNSVQVSFGPGSAASSYKVTVAVPGRVPENFDNITGAGNALWVAIANAINNGLSGFRGKSSYVVASAGAGTSAPSTASYTLSGGTDGATTITSATLVGSDSAPRTGMYSLRGAGCSIAFLADADDSTQWSAQVAFGLAEGIYMIGVTPAGDTVANAVSAKLTAGIDSYAMKIMFGDWVVWYDSVNGLSRVVSPQGVSGGMLANLSPEQSTLNKPVQGIQGTQKSSLNQVYAPADLQLLGQNGFDLISNPVPGGSYFGIRFGRNSSSNSVIHGDNYTRMTNFIATTLNAGMGKYVGTLQSPTQQRRAKATLDAYFANLALKGMIADFVVQLDKNNNPPNRVALGYEQADIKVQYLSIVEYLVLNMEGGQSVSINRLPTLTPIG